MLIEPKKYKYKDKLKPDTEVYGFIAQQVREVIGDFGVDLKPEYIYDINDTATITSNIITSEYNLELSSNYKIHTPDGEEKEIVIENILGNNQYEISGYEYILDTSNIETSSNFKLLLNTNKVQHTLGKMHSHKHNKNNMISNALTLWWRCVAAVRYRTCNSHVQSAPKCSSRHVWCS